MLLRDYEFSLQKKGQEKRLGMCCTKMKVRWGIRLFVCYQGRHFYIVNIGGGISCMVWPDAIFSFWNSYVIGFGTNGCLLMG